MFKRFLIKHNIIKGNFYIESFIHVDKNKKPTEISDTVKWLLPFSLNCKYKDKDRLAFEMLNYKYPEYIGYINLF